VLWIGWGKLRRRCDVLLHTGKCDTHFIESFGLSYVPLCSKDEEPVEMSSKLTDEGLSWNFSLNTKSQVSSLHSIVQVEANRDIISRTCDLPDIDLPISDAIAQIDSMNIATRYRK
jgi:hypothetical protein